MMNAMMIVYGKLHKILLDILTPEAPHNTVCGFTPLSPTYYILYKNSINSIRLKTM